MTERSMGDTPRRAADALAGAAGCAGEGLSGAAWGTMDRVSFRMESRMRNRHALVPLAAAMIGALGACGSDYHRVDPPGRDQPEQRPIVPERDPGANTDQGRPLHGVLSAPQPPVGGATRDSVAPTVLP